MCEESTYAKFKMSPASFLLIFESNPYIECNLSPLMSMRLSAPESFACC